MAKVSVSKKEKEEKQKALKVQKKVESSDEESSEDESSEEEVVVKKTAASDSDSDSSSSGSSSESGSESSDSEDSSESGSGSEEEAPKKVSKKDESDDEESDESDDESSENGQEEEEEEEAPKKKIKTDTGAKAVTPAKAPVEAGSCSVFVGRLAWATTDDSLKAHFKKCGKIVSVRVATDRETGKSRGFGHIDFETAEAAQAALEYEQSELDGRQIHVEISQGRNQNSRAPAAGGSDDGTTVFIKGFDSNQTEEDVRAALQEAFGACGEVTRISLPMDRESGYLKGIAFIDFATKEGKTKAGELSGTEVAGGNIFVDLNSKPKSSGGSDGGRGGRGGFGRGGRGGQRIDASSGGSGRKMSFDD
uniref:RRM domain-containing protein n=1 Tax=Polytomella parva TaxID=51329 RepID=A0A7S0VK70_9CHLO|mmetsp:Transcript_7716/g.15088  ORF Transcript_7716/g.15088 Transcript_7716/m.15088 type:complete len:364 (+) Transcript_7716:82-1173(+)